VSDVELKKTAERQTAQIIKRELDRKDYEETAWLKAFKKAKGNEEQARGIYAEIREAILLGEIYISLKEKVDQKIKEVEWYRDEQNKIKQRKSENKKEPPLTDYEKQQIKNKYLKNVESDASIKSNIPEKSFLSRFLDGEVPLVISYWIIAALIPTIIYVIDIEKNGNTTTIIALILLAYYVFAFIGTWKSAGNYIRKNDPPFWGYAARVMIIFAILKFVVNLISGLK
jgi:hypothetical protein